MEPRAIVCALALAAGGCANTMASPDVPGVAPKDSANADDHRIAPEGAPFSLTLPGFVDITHTTGPSGIHSLLATSEVGVVAVLWLDHRSIGRALPQSDFETFARAPLAGMTRPVQEPAVEIARPGASRGWSLSFRAGNDGELHGKVVAFQLPGWLLAVMVGGLADSHFAPGGSEADAIFHGVATRVGDDDAPSTQAAIQRLVLESGPIFKACYQQRLADQPDLAGTLSLDLRFGSDGSLERCAIADDSVLRDAQLEACVVEEAGRWEIPAPTDQNPVEFRYPLHFQP